MKGLSLTASEADGSVVGSSDLRRAENADPALESNAVTGVWAGEGDHVEPLRRQLRVEVIDR